MVLRRRRDAPSSLAGLLQQSPTSWICLGSQDWKFVTLHGVIPEMLLGREDRIDRFLGTLAVDVVEDVYEVTLEALSLCEH